MTRAAVTLIAVALAACGSDEPPADPGPTLPTDGVYGHAPPAVRGVPSVVTLSDAAPVDVAAGEPPRMDQLGLQFSPTRLVVRVGEPVRFTNSESLAHNIHIRSIEPGETVFNADTPPGGSATFVFEREGAYDILCDIHPGMTAIVFATEARYAVFADDDGSFHVGGAAPGDYVLSVWSADPTLRTEAPVTVAAGHATEVTLAPIG